MSEHCAFLLSWKGDGGQREGEGWEKEGERRLKRERFLRWLEVPGRETKERAQRRVLVLNPGVGETGRDT